MAKVILLVDDEEVNRDLVKMCLEREGYEIVTAFDGSNALEILEYRDDIDLILMDMMMPRMSGFETIKNIKNRIKFRLIPIMALTGLSDKESVMNALKIGADDYVVKPFSVDELRQKVRILLKIREFVKRWGVLPK